MKHNGFTLIELMIVVAIIGILASIALPEYQQYITRAQVSESMTLASGLKSRVTEYHKHTGYFPENNEEAGIPPSNKLLGNYVSSIEMVDGAFHVTLGNKVNKSLQNKILTLRPIVVTGSPASPFSWLCGTASVPEGMEAVGEDRTDIDKSLLPAVCHI
ncbi:pilus assembly protein PilA [Gammaproteobacteria bacterium 45_16_T64]|nr:pilus assembly protein PilA [Gammaproteobacteria bacterium 45_16_T64]